MINQFTSIRNSSAINLNNCENVEIDAETKAANRICTTDDGDSTARTECDKIMLTTAVDKSYESSDSNGQTNECAINAIMSPTPATKSEIQINFSVDRLLSKTDVNDGKIASTNKLNNLWRNGHKSVLTIDQLLSTSTRTDRQQTSKQIVRPMPMRYLLSTTSPTTGK